MPCCARNIGKDGHCKSRTVLLHILSEGPNTVQRIGSIWPPSFSRILSCFIGFHPHHLYPNPFPPAPNRRISGECTHIRLYFLTFGLAKRRWICDIEFFEDG